MDRFVHFDVNVQYTAGKNIPLTDFLSRHPIAFGDVTETERENNERDETEAEEEYVVNQIYGLFNQTNGSITQYIGQSPLTQKKTNHKAGRTRMNKTKTTILLKQTVCKTAIFQFEPNIDHRVLKWMKLMR